MDAAKQTATPMDSNGSALHSLAGSAREVQREAGALLGALEDASADVDSFVREEMVKHPYALLVGVAGVGFILGGGLATRLTRTALSIGGRLAIAVAARRLATATSISTSNEERIPS